MSSGDWGHGKPFTKGQQTKWLLAGVLSQSLLEPKRTLVYTLSKPSNRYTLLSKKVCSEYGTSALRL